MSTAQAHAVQIGLSGDNIDRYFRILEHYVLPLMVVSTIVLFCGYVASRIYHRTVARTQNGIEDEAPLDDTVASPYDGTAAFLRELRATPPIEDPEPKREPKARAQHPLLRKRAANAAAALRARPATEPPPAPVEPAPSTNALRFNLSNRLADRPQPERTPEPRLDSSLESRHESGHESRHESRSEPKIETPPLFDPPGMFEPDAAPRLRETRAPAPAYDDGGDDGGEEAPQRTAAEDTRTVDTRPAAGGRRSRRDLLAGGALRAGRDDDETAERASDREPERTKLDPPPIAATSNWWQDSEDAPRSEPPEAVVQALKMGAPPPGPDMEAAKARAGEIGDSLDYAASVLQQAATLLAERMQIKKGLERDEVRAMRVTGFAPPPGVEEELRKLGGDVAQEVASACGAVASFDNVLHRLEQMAEAEPLDEGWNDLLRTRISDTLYAVGQVRKTLGGYRPAPKKPGRSPDNRNRPGGASGGGPDRPVPVGRRQV
ncbi:MAG: hypothetical protein GEU87_11450 [Alphaproteobacteria bacterium]|nr:hypothetical protein [Alphaproteobacteria bacterium]